MQQHTVRRRQLEDVAEGGEDLGRGVAVTALFEPGEVFDADAGEGGELGAAQPRRATAKTRGQARLGRGEGFAAGTQEGAQLVVVHLSNVQRAPAQRVALPLLPFGRSPLPRRRARTMRA